MTVFKSLKAYVVICFSLNRPNHINNIQRMIIWHYIYKQISRTKFILIVLLPYRKSQDMLWASLQYIMSQLFYEIFEKTLQKRGDICYTMSNMRYTKAKSLNRVRFKRNIVTSNNDISRCRWIELKYFTQLWTKLF